MDAMVLIRPHGRNESIGQITAESPRTRQHRSICPKSIFPLRFVSWERERTLYVLNFQLETFNFSFFGNFAVIIGFNRPNNRRDNDHVEKICRNSIGDVRIRLWICSAVECGHRSD